MRNPEYQFIEATADSIIAELTTKYEELTNTTVHPSSPVKLFLSWCAAAILQIYQNINYIERYDPDYVVILSGDHIYKMDYNKMLEVRSDQLVPDAELVHSSFE